MNMPAASTGGGAAQANPAAAARDAFLASLSDEKKLILKKIHDQIAKAQTFSEGLPETETLMLKFLDAERLTVYQNGRNGHQIIAKYKTGAELHEIRLPLSATSIAGYVAVSGQPLCIPDVHNAAALAAIYRSLCFDASYDEKSGFTSKSMLVVPIRLGKPLLGVLQIINKTNKGVFGDSDLKSALYLAGVLAKKFHEEFQGTSAPYELLVKRELITQAKVDEFTARAPREKVSMTFLLASEGKIPLEMIAASLESYYQFPFMRFDPAITPPKKLLKKLNMGYLRRQKWVPLAGELDGEIVILIDDPTDVNRQMEIQRALPAKKYVFRVGFAEDIMQYLGAGTGTGIDIQSITAKMSKEDADVDEDSDSEGISTDVDENASTVIQVVNQLIMDAQRMGASDIHIEPSKGKLPSKVRFRIDGICQQVLDIPASHIGPVLSRIKIMSRLDIAERRLPQDGKIVVRVSGKPLELRVATIPTVHGESAVMRVLASGGALPYEKLNLNDRNFRELDRIIKIPQGIVLVVGPTGSGKTTTLHAVLGRINTPDRKIWTAEDPVEITQPGMAQVQMNHKVGLNFAAALRAFLRADPDIILIGEMRDRETAHSGIEASLTGHLVFSTLHTNSAPETITRLLDLGLDPMNFADALLGILAQRLVRTLCGNCKEGYKPSDEDWQRLVKLYGEQYFDEMGFKQHETELFGPKGCSKCGDSGYKGRTGIHELLLSSPKMKLLVAANARVAEMRDLAVEEGMRTLIQDGVWKVLKGQLDLPQLFRVAAE